MDDKLRELVETMLLNNGSDIEIIDFYIEAIEQVFKEEGYRFVGETLGEITDKALRKHEYMTGAEWYGRFEAELNKYDIENFKQGDALRIAKKASGL